MLILVDGAVPEPWRHEPDPAPGARLAPTADAGLVQRTMHEWFPAATALAQLTIEKLLNELLERVRDLLHTVDYPAPLRSHDCPGYRAPETAETMDCGVP